MILTNLVGCKTATPAVTATPSVLTQTSSSEQSASEITARMLVEPGALMGSGPSGFNWGPVGSVLAYVEPQDDGDVLMIYDAASGDKRVLLDPGGNPDGIDLASAQWSPQGDSILLSGATSLWLLDVQTGELKSIAQGSGGQTGLTFSPDVSLIA